MHLIRSLLLGLLCALLLLPLSASQLAAQKRGRRGARAQKRPPAAAPAQPALPPDLPAQAPAEAQPASSSAGSAGTDTEPTAASSASSASSIGPASAAANTAAGASAAANASASPAASAVAVAEATPADTQAQGQELATLNDELAAVMDELVQARATVAVLGKALFKTRVRLLIDNQASDDQRAERVVVSLDGAPIYRGDGDSLPSDPEHPLFDGFSAPGPHELTVELQQVARERAEYRYDVRNTFHFEVVRERRTELRVVIDDDSDIAEDFPDDQEGEYDMQLRLAVRALPLGQE